MSTGVEPSERELGLVLAEREVRFIGTILEYTELGEVPRKRLHRGLATIGEALTRARADLRTLDSSGDGRRYG